MVRHRRPRSRDKSDGRRDPRSDGHCRGIIIDAMNIRRLSIAAALSALVACSTGDAGAVSCSMPVPQKQAGAPGSHDRLPIGQLPDIDADAVLAHTKTLSSDEYEGRAPGTKGETLTVAYLVDQFRKIGLKPGNTDGSYVQKVPLVGITPTPAPLVFTRGGQ